MTEQISKPPRRRTPRRAGPQRKAADASAEALRSESGRGQRSRSANRIRANAKETKAAPLKAEFWSREKLGRPVLSSPQSSPSTTDPGGIASVSAGRRLGSECPYPYHFARAGTRGGRCEPPAPGSRPASPHRAFPCPQKGDLRACTPSEQRRWPAQLR